MKFCFADSAHSMRVTTDREKIFLFIHDGMRVAEQAQRHGSVKISSKKEQIDRAAALDLGAGVSLRRRGGQSRGSHKLENKRGRDSLGSDHASRT